MKKTFIYATILLLLLTLDLFAQPTTEKWEVFELTLEGPDIGNPFLETRLKATFTHDGKSYEPEGYYDGNGIYKIRFMPDREGVWSYITSSNRSELNNQKGRFICVPARKGNHGPVRIRDTYHFEYADGTPFFPFGSTIYEWPFQESEKKAQTIRTLKAGPFNKVRFLAVPPFKEKYVEGPLKITVFPFLGTSKANWDFSRFNPAYFKNLDSCVGRLMEIGVEADLILFRPYDKGKWGFDMMDQATNIRFTRYMVARYGAFRNIWWSLANENSFMKNITDLQWDELFKVIRDQDPYQHLRSIHNADRLYDYTQPWVTHVSLQYYNAVKAPWGTPLLKDIYKKAIVHDEINYEGDIASRWGRLSGEELTFRFWNAYIGGGYATHGESYTESPWISEGGTLMGSSPARIGFLRKIVESGPPEGLEPIDRFYENNMAGKLGDYYLIYFGKTQPAEWDFMLPRGVSEGAKYRVEMIDTWNMTIEPVQGVFEIVPVKGNKYHFTDIDKKKVRLPGRPYMALRIQKIDEGVKKAAQTEHELE